MASKEEILQALKTIQNVCKENKSCDECPLAIEGWCEIQNRSPEDWKIKPNDTWKAFED